ncbi:hypothetical protein FJTKL_00660 [Diaporthe vaccinii]|uniref:Uncharacterized protein n=1 Tax=Diaporthe vaccinii TaxID=105482 RepID=A0ABR4F675_9PEZI
MYPGFRTLTLLLAIYPRLTITPDTTNPAHTAHTHKRKNSTTPCPTCTELPAPSAEPRPTAPARPAEAVALPALSRRHLRINIAAVTSGLAETVSAGAVPVAWSGYLKDPGSHLPRKSENNEATRQRRQPVKLSKGKKESKRDIRKRPHNPG